MPAKTARAALASQNPFGAGEIAPVARPCGRFGSSAGFTRTRRHPPSPDDPEQPLPTNQAGVARASAAAEGEARKLRFHRAAKTAAISRRCAAGAGLLRPTRHDGCVINDRLREGSAASIRGAGICRRRSNSDFIQADIAIRTK
jgi:hypothetical protein